MKHKYFAALAGAALIELVAGLAVYISPETFAYVVFGLATIGCALLVCQILALMRKDREEKGNDK